ncbi:dynactin subunit 3, partial [Striga asiatica]
SQFVNWSRDCPSASVTRRSRVLPSASVLVGVAFFSPRLVFWQCSSYKYCWSHSGSRGSQAMAKGLIWVTAEDMARNRSKVLTLYRQILRTLNSPNLPLNLAARLAKKAEARAIFMLASEERSVHNIQDLIDTGEYALSVLRKGEIPKYALI